MSCKKIPVAICSAVVGASCFWPNVTMASPVPVAAATVAAEAVSNALPSSGDLSAEVRYFSPNLDARAHSDSINYKGGNINLKDDLDFSDKNAPELVLRYRNVSVDWIYATSDGSTKLDGDLKLDNKKFLNGSNIHADSKLNYVNVKVASPIIAAPHIKTTWNYGIAIINWKMSADGTDSETSGSSAAAHSASASESYTVPIPLVGVGAEAELGGGVSAYANISCLPLASYGHFYDLETGLKYKPIPYFSLSAGYRRVDINVHHGDDRGNFVLDGPWAGISYNF